MAIVEINLPHHSYEVHIQPRLLGCLGEMVRAVAPHARAAVLADRNVVKPHGDAAVASLADAGYDVTLESCDMGEGNKSLDTVRGFYDVLLDKRMERRSPVIALGGGVAGDTVGFVAATYLRGVPFIQCPTTLLAMVDASVGGKVGVNVPQGKNLIGAFYQPHLVVVDIDTLQTLDGREIRCGLAECVKHGVIRDEALFDLTQANVDAILALDSDVLVELVERNVRIKADVVMQDEKESGLRAILNFGHTFAHAIEACTGEGADRGVTGEKYHHGEAVSLGMVAATKLAVAAGRCDTSVLDRLTALLEKIGLPTSAPDLPATDMLIDSMRLDKKVAGDKIRLVLPDRMGQVSVVDDTPAEAIAAAWDGLR